MPRSRRPHSRRTRIKWSWRFPGPGNLADFLKSRRKKHGADSELYSYWMKQIGDPERDAGASPRVACPARGSCQGADPAGACDADEIVRTPQSQELKNCWINRTQDPADYTRRRGDSGWSEENERTGAEALGDFLLTKIGPGIRHRPETSK